MTDLTTRTDVADWLSASGIGPVDNVRNSDDTYGTNTRQNELHVLGYEMIVRP